MVAGSVRSGKFAGRRISEAKDKETESCRTESAIGRHGACRGLVRGGGTGAAFGRKRNIPTGRASGIVADPPRWISPREKGAAERLEYQAIFDWNTADQKAGGHGTEPSWMCLPPRHAAHPLNAYEPMEIRRHAGAGRHIHDGSVPVSAGFLGRRCFQSKMA